MKQEYQHITHPFQPVYNTNCRILILGSFPSVKSREENFFYGNPHNRFWKVLSALLGEEFPDTSEGKRVVLLRHGIALWDVIASCDIRGSDDASIRNALPTDLSEICSSCRVIFTNGSKAYSLYEKYQYPLTGIHAIPLPSTSPANAAYSQDRLIQAWEPVRSALKVAHK